MVVEFVVWGSREWSEQVQPLLAEHLFTELPDLHWADPESDGERMGFSYTYTGKEPLPWASVSALMTRIEALLEDAEAPLEAIRVCAEPG